MKLWKNLSLEKKVISRQDNMKEIMSFKSSKLINQAKTVNYEKHYETKKSLDKSYSSSSLEDEEKSKKNYDDDLNNLNTKTLNINLADDKLNDLKLLTTTLSSDFTHTKKNSIRSFKKNNNNIKSIYPTIPNKKRTKKDSLFKIQLKKIISPSSHNKNSLLNKWQENVKKLYNKTLKKAKKDMIQILKKHKIQNMKKKYKTRNININNIKKENEENNLDLLNTQNYDDEDNNAYNSPKEKTNYLEKSANSTSPLKNTFTFMSQKRSKNYISSDHYTESSFSSKTINKFDNYNNYRRSYNSIRGYQKNNYKRKINYKDYIKEENILNNKWKKKLGILNLDIKYGTELLSNLSFQFNTIRDEINLISDCIHFFKTSIFCNGDLLTAFNDKDTYIQININKTLEETCALLSLTPKIILKEYYYHCDKFISLSEPKKEFLFNKVIYNEMDCFNENIKLLFKIVNFIRACFEVYVQLVNQVDEEMLIPKNDFELLRTIFEKCRYYVGNLTNFANNLLKDYNFDKNMIKKSEPILNDMKERLKEENKSIYDYLFYDNNKKKKDKINEIRNRYHLSRKTKKEDNLSKIANNYKIESDEYFQKLKRIKRALDNSEIKNFTDEIRLKKLGLSVGKPMALIFSPLMTKMLKYIKKDSREKIIALRSTEKFFPVKENEEEGK